MPTRESFAETRPLVRGVQLVCNDIVYIISKDVVTVSYCYRLSVVQSLEILPWSRCLIDEGIAIAREFRHGRLERNIHRPDANRNNVIVVCVRNMVFPIKSTLYIGPELMRCVVNFSAYNKGSLVVIVNVPLKHQVVMPWIVYKSLAPSFRFGLTVNETNFHYRQS